MQNREKEAIASYMYMCVLQKWREIVNSLLVYDATNMTFT